MSHDSGLHHPFDLSSVHSESSGVAHESVCVDFASPNPNARIFIYDLAVGLPALAFLVFLFWNVKTCLRKLRRSQSDIMATYYAFLWAVTTLNLIRCCVQIAHASNSQPVMWNMLWLVTRFGMVVLEVSVVVFLLHGYLTTGREALQRTLVLSGIVAGCEAALEAGLIFGAHVPLFLFGGSASSPSGDVRAPKWAFWLVASTLRALVYGALLLLPRTRWRDLLPAKPAFFTYARVLLLMHGTLALGAAMLLAHAHAGYCVAAAAHWAHAAAYAPLLYATFLREFFADSDLDPDLLYYSEMREAGCFDEDDGGDAMRYAPPAY